MKFGSWPPSQAHDTLEMLFGSKAVADTLSLERMELFSHSASVSWVVRPALLSEYPLREYRDLICYLYASNM